MPEFTDRTIVGAEVILTVYEVMYLKPSELDFWTAAVRRIRVIRGHTVVDFENAPVFDMYFHKKKQVGKNSIDGTPEYRDRTMPKFLQEAEENPIPI